MADKTPKQLAVETHETVIQLKTTLVGSNGDRGLVGEIKDQREQHHRDMKDIRDDHKEYAKHNEESHALINTRHSSLSQRVWLLIGVLAGSGILGASIYSALNMGQ